VLLDGVDIRKVNLTWLREQLSLVSQEPHLFTGTVRDNITYGKEGATDEEVVTSFFTLINLFASPAPRNRLQYHFS